MFNECKERIPHTKEGAELLLNYGLRITDIPSLRSKSTSGTSLDEFEASVARYRLIFLRFHERLSLYLKLVKGVYRAEEYLEFRSRDLGNVCLSLIENLELERAQEILELDEVRLLRPQILSSLPETLNPSDYETLLPIIDGSSSLSTPTSSPQLDFLEVETIRQSLGLTSFALFDVLQHFARYGFQKVPTFILSICTHRFWNLIHISRNMDVSRQHSMKHSRSEKSLQPAILIPRTYTRVILRFQKSRASVHLSRTRILWIGIPSERRRLSLLPVLWIMLSILLRLA